MAESAAARNREEVKSCSRWSLYLWFGRGMRGELDLGGYGSVQVQEPITAESAAARTREEVESCTGGRRTCGWVVRVEACFGLSW